jgi:hypothetical protein
MSYDTNEWKPGDVAAFGTTTAMRTETGWAYRDASVGGLHQDTYRQRRLVVIDPEDAEQVKRLFDVWCDIPGGLERGKEPLRLATALRAFANPTPSIEEPRGLGAVVVDYDGNPWVKVDTAMACNSWTQADAGAAGSDTWVKFAKLRATRRLSEGVTP